MNKDLFNKIRDTLIEFASAGEMSDTPAHMINIADNIEIVDWDEEIKKEIGKDTLN